MKRSILNIFLFFPAIIFAYGCACNSGTQKMNDVNVHLTEIKMEVQIPEPIVQKGNEIIIKRTGSQFFNNYIKLNILKCREIPDAYFLSYSFQIPGKDFIDEEITFILDKQGRVKPGFEIVGIPECRTDSSACRFDITKERAVEIAQQAGLQPGIKDWDASFEWDSSFGKYVWLIKSTSSESMGSNGKRGTGEKMLIDANSGEVLTKTEWKVF